MCVCVCVRVCVRVRARMRASERERERERENLCVQLNQARTHNAAPALFVIIVFYVHAFTQLVKPCFPVCLRCPSLQFKSATKRSKFPLASRASVLAEEMTYCTNVRADGAMCVRRQSRFKKTKYNLVSFFIKTSHNAYVVFNGNDLLHMVF